MRYNLQSINDTQHDLENKDENNEQVDAEGFTIEENNKDGKDKKSLSRRRVFKK